MGIIFDGLKTIYENFLVSDFIFKYKAKALKNGVENGSDDTKKYCEKELDMLSKERITKTKNREIANYFIGLSIYFNHSIAPDNFKKLYPYLIIKQSKVELSHDMLKKLESSNNSFKFLGISSFVLFIIFAVLSIYKSIPFTISILGICLLFCAVILSSQIIQKHELKNFREKIDEYNNQF